MKFRLDSATSLDISGGADSLMGIQGLTQAYLPLQAHCNGQGGKLDVLARSPVGSRSVASRISCATPTTELWLIDVTYTDVSTQVLPNPGILAVGKGIWLQLTPRMTYRSGQALVEFREQLRAREVENRDREARAKAQSARDAAARAAERAAFEIRAEKFRASIRQGDAVVWLDKTQNFKAYGMVIRVEGDLLLVQFENITFSGASTRYVRRAEVLPPDGTRPSEFFESR